MIDIHAHILPGMDDGSADAGETAQLLCLSRRQGVTLVAATPHFYAIKDTPENFLSRRQAAVEKMEYDAQAMPRLLLGAEVAYFDGMDHCEELRQLQIGQSSLLLVEMPFTAWSDRMVYEIISFRNRLGLQPVLAHVDRYDRRDQFPKYRRMLLEEGVLFQCNAEAFLAGFSGARYVRMLKRGELHFLGSDCHNMRSRPPKLDQTQTVITRKLGSQAIEKLDAFAKNMLFP